MYFTKLQEERFKRDSAIYDDFLELHGKHGELVSTWKLAGVLAPRYGMCQMGIWRIIMRMEDYRNSEAQGTDKC